MGASEIIGLLGGIALFLFGMAIMGDGLKKVAGSKLELVLYKLTSTPLKGVLLGTGVTAVIQSSSATSVMVVGFVNSGMMKVNQAIGIVMGAILGTSVTGWILCLSSLSGGSGWVTLLSTATLTGLVAVVGIVLRMAAKRPSTHHIGDILLGFAVLMYGMSAMSDAVSPLRDSQVFIDALTSFSNPLLGILAGLLFTSVIQSASAAVGILQALAVTGAITFEIALPIIMGIAIGAAVPVLLSALGANVSGKRTAFVYLLIDVLGVVIWATVFYIANAIAHFDFMTMTMTTVSIALMNTLFRLATVIVLAPLIGVLEKCVCLLIPENPESVREEQEMDRLEERFLLHPALALEQSRQVTDAMAQRAMDNLLRAMDLVHKFSDKGCRAVEDAENAIDRYEDRLGTYLMKITGKELSQRQSEEVSKYLHTISDFERISDHALNICDAAREPLLLPEVDKFLPTETGEPPLGHAVKWAWDTVNQKVTEVSKIDNQTIFPLELCTMPGFAGSSAYYLRYMDPRNDKALVAKDVDEYWRNVDLYIGGTEHATGHLIYSRFWNKFLFDLGIVCEEEPFKKLINQGMIQGRSNFVYRINGTNKFVSLNLKDQYEVTPIHVDVNIVSNDLLDIEAFKNWRPEYNDAEFVLEDGKYICGWAVEKMSKSMFNVVNPDMIVEKYGADTLRLYEMFLGPLEQSKPWDTNGIDGVHRFLKKLWGLFFGNTDTLQVTDAEPTADELKSLHKLIKKVTFDIEHFSYNTSISAFMICVNELTSLKCSKRAILEPLITLLAPFAPHITEELWHQLGHDTTICDAQWPEHNEEYLVEKSVTYVISFNGKARFNLELPADISREDAEKAALSHENSAKWMEGKTVKKVIVVPGKIVNIVVG